MTLLRDLSIALGLGAHDLLHIISNAPARYKVFQIDKRGGGKRTIAQPSRELKAIQRYVLHHILSKLPVHPAAMGYAVGRSIGRNAEMHIRSRVILKLDFKEFFPSIVVDDWRRYARARKNDIAAADIATLSNILFWGQRTSTPKCLSIGAPTSPALSNILMAGLDTRFSDCAEKTGVVYTRYADDITVSADSIKRLLSFEAAVRSVVNRTKSPHLTFNDEKRGIYTSGERRMVTGLVITLTQEISLGRGRKRLMSAMLHKVRLGVANVESMGRLKGLLAFAIANEPDFVSRMREKYGSDVVDRILKFTRISRMRCQFGGVWGGFV